MRRTAMAGVAGETTTPRRIDAAVVGISLPLTTSLTALGSGRPSASGHGEVGRQTGLAMNSDFCETADVAPHCSVPLCHDGCRRASRGTVSCREHNLNPGPFELAVHVV